MYARAVDDASARLEQLRQEEWQDFALAALAFGIAVGATQIRPEFALPLFLGGMVVVARGVRALWRRWDLVERLAGERDAYVISEVRHRASQEATMDRRRTFAAAIRSTLQPGVAREARVVSAAEELEELARELDDDLLAFDPACAVACARLITDIEWSPLLNAALPPQDLRSRVRQIRAGFHA